jgi:hypothetical protein
MLTAFLFAIGLLVLVFSVVVNALYGRCTESGSNHAWRPQGFRCRGCIACGRTEIFSRQWEYAGYDRAIIERTA